MSVGGRWSGLLFENARTGFPLSLVWTFSFDFESVVRDGYDMVVGLEVDWVPLPGATWRRMQESVASSDAFGEPIEASVYFFDHHRFDKTRLEIVEQDNSCLRVRASLSGDIDLIGMDQITVDAWLDFDGIYVQPEVQPPSVAAAEELLAQFTDTDGLVCVVQPHDYLFRLGPG